jgi:hypothetical protein
VRPASIRASFRATRKFAGMDDVISLLFEEWLCRFEAEQAASANGAMWREDALREIEAKIAATPAEGLKGLGIKLALYSFLQENGDAESSQAQAAYRDLVRLSGYDPLVEINARFKKSA